MDFNSSQANKLQQNVMLAMYERLNTTIIIAILTTLNSLTFETSVYLPKMAQWSYFSFTQDRTRKGIINHRGLSPTT